jgi:acyl-CoA dehydrogenase
MTAALSPENTDLHAFREALRTWLNDNAPEPLRGTASTPFQGYWGGSTTGFENDAQKEWFERCLARGWTAPTWPSAYGGGDMPIGQYRIFQEELRAMAMPLPLVGFGLTMIGPILLAEGTEAQRARHVSAIVRGEVRWCQGYSEPDAGSDLASLRTKAVRDGDDWVVDGQKIWTSHADKSDWIFCLVRTDPNVKKQAGITFLLIHMRSPGITTRPIELISGSSPFCEVFFDQVRVPVHQTIGQVNDGWRVAKALLRHERGMVGESVAAGGARVDVLKPYNLRDHAIEVIGLDSQGKLADPLLRDAVAASEMEQALMRLTVRRANDAMKAGDAPGTESSILKVVGTELNQRRWKLAMQIGGTDALGWTGEAFSERDRAICRQWLRSRGNTIEGGSSEIQRNILARSVLRMPK